MCSFSVALYLFLEKAKELLFERALWSLLDAAHAWRRSKFKFVLFIDIGWFFPGYKKKTSPKWYDPTKQIEFDGSDRFVFLYVRWIGCFFSLGLYLYSRCICAFFGPAVALSFFYWVWYYKRSLANLNVLLCFFMVIWLRQHIYGRGNNFRILGQSVILEMGIPCILIT